MIELFGPAELPRARASGRFVGGVLRSMRDRTTVGTNLLEIDDWAAQLIADAGAISSYVDYAPSFGSGPFRHVICTSVNDAVLHGLPHDYALRNGDLLSLDFAASLDGIVTDAAISFVVGDSLDPADLRMIETTRRALEAGITAAVPGARVGDISHAVGTVLTAAGYPVNTEFGGHGVGSTMHQDPHVPNTGRPGRGYRLRPGLLLAIEPWIMATPPSSFPTRMAGPFVAQPAPAPHTASTPSPSPTRGRSSSPRRMASRPQGFWPGGVVIKQLAEPHFIST